MTRCAGEATAAARRGDLPRNDADRERLAWRDFQSTRTRAEVVEETLEAARRGEIAHGELDSEHLAEAGFRPAKTRAQVIAETREATRLGLIPRNEWDYQHMRWLTPAEQELIAEAGRRAADAEQVARR